jgi:hypothetical protein
MHKQGDSDYAENDRIPMPLDGEGKKRADDTRETEMGLQAFEKGEQPEIAYDVAAGEYDECKGKEDT